MVISTGSGAQAGRLPAAPAGNGRSIRKRSAIDDSSTVLAVISPDASELQVQRLLDGLRSRGVEASFYDIGVGTIVLDDVRPTEVDGLIDDSPAVARVIAPETRYRLVRREVHPRGSTVFVGGVPVGGEQFVVVAGPCAVESHSQMLAAARAVAASGAALLRGGAFKPRTSPYDFQGLGMPGVEILAEAREVTGLPFFTEVMDPARIEHMYPLVDGFQVGARNMQNYDLLKALADVDKPVLLKRGPGATVEEWLLAAEYLLAGGNSQVVLCERGIRTFDRDTRFTLDLAAAVYAKRLGHLPVIVDPSHATGDPGLVVPLSLAAVAAGLDGLLVEVHPQPAAALSDGFQALTPTEFDAMMKRLGPLCETMGRPLATHAPARNDRIARDK